MKTLTLLLAIFLSGCLTKPAQVHLSPVGNGVTRIETDIDSASSSVKAATPYTSDVGAAHLTDATTSLTDAKSQVSTTNKALDAAQKAADRLQADDDKTHNALMAEKDHWAGYKTRVLARWIIGISIGVWVIVGLLNVYLSFNPIKFIAPVVSELYSLLPAMNPFEWLTSYISSIKKSPTSAPATGAK